MVRQWTEDIDWRAPLAVVLLIAVGLNAAHIVIELVSFGTLVGANMPLLYHRVMMVVEEWVELV